MKEIVQEESARLGIAALLGTPALEEIWRRHTIAGIESLLSHLEQRRWEFLAKEKHLTGTVAGHEAYGFIDLIFKNAEGGIVVADLKTGRPRKTNGKNLLKKGLFQLPFYSSLASRNGISPVAAACYIHLESSGSVTFEEISAAELEEMSEEFQERVREIVKNINQGRFPKRERKAFNARR